MAKPTPERTEMTTNTTPAIAGQIDTTRSGDQPLVSQTRIEIYTDGSCIGNPGHGGWGAVILRKDAADKIIKKIEISGMDPSTTNIRMEMTAACAALEYLGQITEEPITLFCDANLIPNAMNGWLANWKAKGGKKAGGGVVRNPDLWERLERAAEGRNVTWAWVRGHNGSEFNERADRLAYAGSRKAEKIIKGY
ncbi:MAG: Ribonuclease H [uncultured bacterium]|nr:MAG: Ribonuclease H [uncultured bacterium]